MGGGCALCLLLTVGGQICQMAIYMYNGVITVI